MIKVCTRPLWGIKAEILNS